MSDGSQNNAFDPAQVELLFVDDDNEFRDTAARRFARRGFHVKEAPGVNDALRLLQDRQFDVVVSDMAMPGLTGLDLLQRIKELSPECEVILLTGEATVETAVQAMKLGAYDFLSKPFSLAELETLIQKAYERRRLSQENVQLKAVLERSQPKLRMIGESPVMQEVFKLIGKAGPSDQAILIQGESGTGKELVARALHEHSSRADRPLISINCTALTETLLESELFGHEKGAFTGAVVAKPGLFELADGSTLFINHFLGPDWQIAPDALRVLETYNWPGNIRQLINVIERGKILAEDQFITTDELPAVVLHPTTAAGAAISATSIPAALADDGTLSAIEKARVVEVLQKQKGNKSRAAHVLGISRRSLYRLLEKYGLDGDTSAAEPLGHNS